jgi:nucleotide-binding universal stress UspA family protein
MLQIKRILFPIDFTENSTKFLPYVLSLSEKYDAVIYLLHVVEDLPKWSSGFYIPHIPWDQYREEALKCAEKALDQVCEEKLKGCPNFQKIIVSGDPVLEILKTIEAEEIDLVIMGTHGRKGLEHVFFGSVAENVVKKSPAPVLTLNPYKLKKSAASKNEK